MKIFIPRSVAETSIPFLVNKILTEFVNYKKIIILTRYENLEIMKNIDYVDEVLEVDSKFFQKKTKIINTYTYNINDKIVIPISNKNKIYSYKNVYNFMKKNFQGCKIFYYDFANDKLFKYNFNFSFYILRIFTYILSSLMFLPILFIAILILLISYLKNDK